MEFEREIEDYYNSKKNAFDVTNEKVLDLSSVMLVPFSSQCRLSHKKSVYCCSANQLANVIGNTVKLRVK